MDRERAQALMERLGLRLGDRVLLWRGAELSGSDIDLVVHSGAEPELRETLAEAGLAPTPGARLWESADGALAVDPLPAVEWPAAYPPLGSLSRRASWESPLPPVAADVDRLLIYAAEAVGGRPLAKLARKARPLLADPTTAERLTSLADSLGERALAQLIADPDRLERMAERGRLPYGRAAIVAARSARARRALKARISERVVAKWTPKAPAVRALASRAGARRGRRHGLLIALSGMDGAGKSSASLDIERRLASAGVEASVTWHRLGEESEKLDRIGRPIKRLLRRSVTIADPLASRSPVENVIRQDPRVAAGSHGVVAWTWIVIVTAITVSSYRRTARLARRRGAIVCDRWACDSIVDLAVRYGRHRTAEWLLLHAIPKPDLALLLEIDAETSARRKPEDQALSVLRQMGVLYDRAAELLRVERLDATRPHDAVLADIAVHVERLLAGRE